MKTVYIRGEYIKYINKVEYYWDEEAKQWKKMEDYLLEQGAPYIELEYIPASNRPPF